MNGELILIADDDEQLRNLITRILRGAQFDVIAAQNGIEAVNIFSKFQSRIHLVLLDVFMPKMGGIETYVTLRQIRPNVNVIFITGSGEMTEAWKNLGKGAYDFIQKPFEAKILLAKVREILSSQGSKLNQPE